VLMTPSDPRLHKTMAELSPQPHRDPWASRRASSFTEAIVAEPRRTQPHAGTSREQATVERNRPQRSSASLEFTLGAVNRSQ
jgi:hypothetical protein